MKTIAFQLFAIGQLTGNAISFGFYITEAEAMEKAATLNPDLFGAPYVIFHRANQ